MLDCALGLHITNPNDYCFLNASAVSLKGRNPHLFFAEYTPGHHSLMSAIEVNTITVKCMHIHYECACRVQTRIAFVSLNSVWIFVFWCWKAFLNMVSAECFLLVWILFFQHSLKLHSLTFVGCSHHILFSIAYVAIFSGFCAFCYLWLQGLF